jgi:hypothetical protein
MNLVLTPLVCLVADVQVITKSATASATTNSLYDVLPLVPILIVSPSMR